MLDTKQKISFALPALLISSQVSAIDVSYQSYIKPSAVALDAIRHKGSNAPRVTQANNGIPVVDIADVNNAGVSNNYFTDFNVGKEGLIFNNSKDLFVNTALAGYINGNSNLTNEASLILTQVTGSNPSSLLGVMEIAGKRSDLIIANPNGITCNGCGVLNAKSFTLSTGVISQEEIDRVNNINELNKTLTMMIERGHINIEALNASNVEKLNIIAKSASVNGNLLASDLQFILGKNKIFFDLSNKSDASLLLYEAITTKNAKGEEQKALALDVAHLGSVVANSIYLVVTDEGVGVKNSGTMATIGSKEKGDGGFVIDVNGVVTISTPQSGKSSLDKDDTAPTLSSSANLEIKAKELHNGSIISANTDVNITADKVENKSTYKIKEVVTNYTEDSWKVNIDNKIYVKRWTVEEQVDDFSPAMIQSGGNLNIKANNIANDMGLLNSDSLANFDTQVAFENKAPELKVKIYKQEYKWIRINGKKKMRFEGLENQWYSKNNLPQVNIQDLVLSNQEAILSNALVFASTPTYTQEEHSEYTDLSSYLASSSYQEYVKSHYYRDPNYSDALLQKEIEFAVQKDSYRQQNAQAINTVFDNLERRLQETKEAKKNINPNELTSAGISAENVKIEGGEITNSSLIEAGHIAIIGDAVLNENGTIISREDLNIQAGDFKNFGADLIAGNDMTINADNVEIGTLVSTVEGITERHTTSSLLANNIIINFNNDAKFTSVNMEANNNLSISAKENVIFDVAQNKDFSKRESSSFSVELSNNSVTNTYKHTTTSITTTSSIGNSLKGGSISITAGKDLESYNMQVQSKGDIALNAGGNVTVGIKADQVIEEDRVTTKTQAWNAKNKVIQTQESTEDLPPRIVSSNRSSNDFVSGGDILINSGGNSSFTSISLDANKKVEINSQGDVAFDTVTKNVHTTQQVGSIWFPSYSKTDSVVQISNSLNGESVSINSGKNLTANNLGIQAKNDVVLKADGDITLTTKEDKHHTQRFFTGKKEDKTDLTDYNVQAINGNNITISAGKDAHLSSVDMGAKDNLSISASGDVLLDTLVKKQVDTTKTESTKVRWFKTTKTTTTIITTTNTNIANNLSGNNISIRSKKDLTGFNVKADAKENLIMEADSNLTLSTKADTTHKVEDKREEIVGIFTHNDKNPIRHNVGISIGSITTNTTTNTNIATHNNQTLSANNITLSSGNKTTLESIDTKSENISISGKNVTITALSDSYNQNIHQESTQKTFGIGASVNTNAWGVNVGIRYEERNTTYDKNTQKTTTSSTNITANKITISTANKNDNPQGTINLIGSNLNGSEINLTGKDVSIKNHQTINKVTENKEVEIAHRGGLNLIGLGGGNFVTVGGIYGALEDWFNIPKPANQNTSFSHSTINTGSNLVGDNINITSEKNTNIIGSNLTAKNETNLKAYDVNIKGSEDVHIKGGYGFGYDVTAESNLSFLARFVPTFLDLEAYAQAQANASLDTKVNNSSITSNTINISTSFTPKEVIEGSKVDWSKILKNTDRIKASGAKLQNSWLALQEAKKGNGNFQKAQDKFKNALIGFGASIVLNIDKKVLQNNLNLIHNAKSGSITISGGNLKGENIKLDAGNNLTLQTQKEIHANLNAGMNVTAESIGSLSVAIPVDFRGNIENGKNNKELKDALQINLSSSSGKQSDIQAENLTINTNNNTTLSGSHIEATKGSITTGTLTEKELIHQDFQISQILDDGRDMWGKYGSAGNGVLTSEGFWTLLDLALKDKLTIQNIDKYLRLGDFKLTGEMNFSQAKHQATISPNISITTTHAPSNEIKQGVAQNQEAMQTTNSQTKETDVKTLVKDVSQIAKKVMPMIDDTQTFIEDVKEVFKK